jgi:predicted DNA-binding protein (UPF0251 family)
MSAALVILPVVWATEANGDGYSQGIHEVVDVVEQQQQAAPELAFYRKYTEGLLRRYVRLSMEAGKVPALLGKEMFRAKVTNYQVHGFDDVVIFVHDVEKCLAKLDSEQQELIERVALQEYTQVEAAGLMGLTPRTLVRRYNETLDVLTEILLERKLLEPMTECQGVGSGRVLVRHCIN